MKTSHPGGLRYILRNLRQLIRPGLSIGVASLSLIFFLHAAQIPAHELPSKEASGNAELLVPSGKYEAEIVSLLTEEIQNTVDRQKRLDGQSEKIPVRIWFGTLYKERALFIDLGDAWIPPGAQYFDSEMEDLTHELRETAIEILMEKNGEMPIRSVEFLFNGKTIEQAFPGETLEIELRDRASAKAKSNSREITPALVVTSAGHGVYHNYHFEDWRPQRDPSNGITEDFITPSYAVELANFLSSRSEATTRFTRSLSTDAHAPSGFQWEQIASRYYLEKILPKQKKIWHSRPNDTSDMRERNEDINSRPLYANFIGANTIIHLHTNAGAPTASGTRVYFHTGRVEDEQLGDSILCGMKELIHAQSGYENFTVQSSATAASDNAENKLATMPSVIVETAFHTNPSDAIALQDPVFRNAAMKGVEKGYRLHAEGKTCKPFKITSIPNVTIQRPGTMTVPVNFEGFPFFPVVLTLEIIECPPGNTCSFSPKTYTDEQESPIIFTYGCGGTSSTVDVARWRAQLTDADNVKTNTVEFQATCLPNSKAIGKAKPTAGDTAIL